MSFAPPPPHSSPHTPLILVEGVNKHFGSAYVLRDVSTHFYEGQVAVRIRTEQAIGVIAGYQFKPTSWVRINLVYGMTRNFDNAYTDAAVANGIDAGRFGINRWVQQANVGPIFTPVKGVNLGLEAIWAQRRTLADEKGKMACLNFLARYYVN